VISCKNLQKKYNQLAVLKGIDLEIQAKEIVCITGESGAGKSTLLHLLGTLDAPTAGEIFFEEKDISSLKGNQLADFRNKNIGFVFQFHQLIPEFSAIENVIVPMLIAKKSMSEARIEAIRILTYLGLGERLEHKPSQLSGGEQQRVAIARALIMNPKVILADEPSGNLDSKNAKFIHELFFKMRDDFNLTFIIVTHNPELAQMADRQIILKDGQLAS
jgi:lipoprotein-releasing system ATP-binding protein